MSQKLKQPIKIEDPSGLKVEAAGFASGTKITIKVGERTIEGTVE